MNKCTARFLRRGRRLVLAAIIALGGLFAGMASLPGQQSLRDCRGHQSDGYHIYVNELSFVKPALRDDVELGNFNQQIQFSLQSKADTLLDQQEPVALVHCADRRPTTRAVYLNKNFIKSLDRTKVILEVWGQLDAETTADEIKNRKATINFVLIPVLAEEGAGTKAAGFQRVQYSKKQPGDNLVQLVSQGDELMAFAAVCVGIRLLKNGENEDALGSLQKAIELLRSTRSLSERSRNALIEYIKEKKAEAIRLGGLEELVS